MRASSGDETTLLMAWFRDEEAKVRASSRDCHTVSGFSQLNSHESEHTEGVVLLMLLAVRMHSVIDDTMVAAMLVSISISVQTVSVIGWESHKSAQSRPGYERSHCLLLDPSFVRHCSRYALCDPRVPCSSLYSCPHLPLWGLTLTGGFTVSHVKSCCPSAHSEGLQRHDCHSTVCLEKAGESCVHKCGSVPRAWTVREVN